MASATPVNAAPMFKADAFIRSPSLFEIWAGIIQRPVHPWGATWSCSVARDGSVRREMEWLILPQYQCGERPRHDAEQDRTDDPGPEAFHDEPLDDRAHEPEEKAVDDEDEEAEREHRHRQRQQDQNGADERIHESQDQR